MILSPEGVTEKIGLDRVRRRLEELAQSSPAIRAIGALQPCSDRSHVERRLQIAGELQACLSFGESIPYTPIEDLGPVLHAARPEGAALSPESILDVLRAVTTARLVGSFFRMRAETYAIVADEWSNLKEDRDLEKDIESVFDEEGHVRDGASPELRRIRKELRRAKQNLRSKINSALSSAAASGYTIRSGRMVIPVIASFKKRVPGFVHDVSATGQTVYIEPQDCLELNNTIREFEIAENREIETIRKSLTDLIRNASEMISRNAELLVQLDLSLAIARLANELDANVPKLNEEGIVRIIDGCNPELLLVFQTQDRKNAVVPLDVELGDAFYTLVISGPNAGGKSITMKSIALMTVMLGMGIPVPASEESTFCLFSRVMADIGDAQSVEDDLSTYSSHLENLNAMLRIADESTLVLIDEAGTGTDPDEGVALARAVLEKLTARKARTVVTTHHGGLKVYAHDADSVANGSMAFDLQTLKPTFVFRLNIPGASYAAEIATKVGLPDPVIARARNLVGGEKVQLESLIASLEESNRLLDSRLSEAEAILRAAEKDRNQLLSRLEALQVGKAEVERRAVEEAQEIVRQANRLVEKVVREIREAQADSARTKEARRKLERARERLSKDSKRLKKKETARNSARRSSERAQGRTKSSDIDVLKEGDRVLLDDGSNVGEVLTITAEEAIIAFGNLKTRVAVNRLTKVGGAPEQRVTIRRTSGSSATLPSEKLEHRIDLRGYRVSEAISRVVALVDEATAANLKSVEILHGKGTGVLRLAIQEYLSESAAVSHFEQADWDEGGAGVTIVWLNA